MKLIVGLGNPGFQYTGTRHNIGFDVVDYLGAGSGVGPFRSKFESLIAEASEPGVNSPILLVKPQTFMNLSGRAVRTIVDFYKVELANILILCDDIMLPLGKLRIRLSGSHGGQNGLRNIEQQLGTQNYTRLRVGVGSPGGGDAAEFVLGRFRPTERAAAQDAVSLAAQAVLVWLREGADKAMNRFNGSGQEEKKAKPPKKPKPEETGEKKTKAGKPQTGETTGENPPVSNSPAAETPPG